METVFPHGCGLFQKDNAPGHTAKMVQEWIEEHNEFKVLTWPPDSPDLSPVSEICWTNKSNLWRPNLRLDLLLNVLVSDTTAHLQVLWSPCIDGSELF